jgi:hypothetical protein
LARLHSQYSIAHKTFKSLLNLLLRFGEYGIWEDALLTPAAKHCLTKALTHLGITQPSPSAVINLLQARVRNEHVVRIQLFDNYLGKSSGALKRGSKYMIRKPAECL